jgi:hypothetical protein
VIFFRSARISESGSDGSPVSEGTDDASVSEGFSVVSVIGSVVSKDAVTLVSSVEGVTAEPDVITLSSSEEVFSVVSVAFPEKDVSVSDLMENGSVDAVSSFSFLPAHPAAKALLIIIPSRIPAAILFLFIHPYLLFSE